MGKKQGIRYLAYFLFFLLAGLFQFLGFREEGNGVFFTLFANLTFFSLILVWTFSVDRRMPDRRSRIILVLIGGLFLLFFILRFTRFYIALDHVVACRYLWYLYYLPELFVPSLSLLLVLPPKRRKAGLALLLGSASLLFALTLTNDLHQWAFRFSDPSFDSFSYVRMPLFYVDIAYLFAMVALTLGFLSFRARKTGGWMRRNFPFLLFLVLAVMDLLFLDFELPFYKAPELLCFSYIALFESCVHCHLFPTNAHYREYFSHSAIPSLILDSDCAIYACSEGAVLPTLEERVRACSGEVDLDGRLSLRASPIPGGVVLVEEDVSSLRKAERELSEIQDSLNGERNLLLYENQMRAKEATLAEKKAIYHKIDALGESLFPEIALYLFAARQKDYEDNVKEALLRLAYLKRKANLLLKEEKVLPSEELALSIQESLQFCPSLSSFFYEKGGAMRKAEMLAIYEDLELILECLGKEVSFLLSLKRGEGGFLLAFLFSEPVSLPPLLKGKAKGKRSEEGYRLTLFYKEARK